MEERHCASWSGFATLVNQIRADYRKREAQVGFQVTSEVLFRGQSNAGWSLATTLERRTDRMFTVGQYLRAACEAVGEVESLTGRRWGVPDWADIRAELNAHASDAYIHLPAYDYLVYMRHHGYPSPLLDWTTSPYVAAYFAFCDSPNCDEVAVYAFVERPEGFKGWSEGEPMIHTLGSHVSTDARHFSQKAVYTVAGQWSGEAREHTFVPHAEVFDHPDPDQDHLIKILLPASERMAALRDLEDFNINAFTLLGTEDGLVQTLATREFELRDA